LYIDNITINNKDKLIKPKHREVDLGIARFGVEEIGE